jgi:hypothetical protein
LDSLIFKKKCNFAGSNFMKKTAVLITVILLIQTGIYSQTMEVGLFGGGSYYLGDINPGVHFQQTKPAAGLIARYNIDTRWSIRMSALVGKVGGSDAISQKVLDRNLEFTSSITEIASVVEFNFYPYVNGSARNYFTPYIFGGASVFMFNPKFNNEKLADFTTEGQVEPYLLHGLAIPFGIGVKYSVSQSIGLGFEWGMRKTFTDYIDDISTTYPDIPIASQADFRYDLSDPTGLHNPGEQRGNPKTMDWFNFIGISITVEFDIFDRSTCVDFTNGYRK